MTSIKFKEALEPEPEDILEQYQEDIFSQELAEAACNNDLDQLQGLLFHLPLPVTVEANSPLKEANSPLKEAYNWIAVKRYTFPDDPVVYACSENLSEQVVKTLTNNFSLVPYLLDSLIIFNQDGKNYNLIVELARKLKPGQVIDVLTSALNMVLALSTVENLEDISTEGKGELEAHVPSAAGPMNITSQEAQLGVRNSIVPLSQLSSRTATTIPEALGKIIAATTDKEKVLKLLVALPNLGDPGLNKVLEKFLL